MKLFYKNLFLAVWVFAALPALCQPAVTTKVQRGVAQRQMVHSASVQLNFSWKKQEFLERRVRFHPGKKIRVPYPAEYKTTQCMGVLLNTSKVATPATCAKDGNGFELEKVTLTFTNGKQAVGTAKNVQINGEIAQISVAASVINGLEGLEAYPVCAGKTLQDVYGSSLAADLQQFLLEHGVISPRASRVTGRKVSLQKGEPFVWEGKLVALVSRVPSRLPTALFGQMSEDFLAVFR